MTSNVEFGSMCLSAVVVGAMSRVLGRPLVSTQKISSPTHSVDIPGLSIQTLTGSSIDECFPTPELSCCTGGCTKQGDEFVRVDF